MRCASGFNLQATVLVRARNNRMKLWCRWFRSRERMRRRQPLREVESIVKFKFKIQNSKFETNSNNEIRISNLGEQGSTFVIVLWIAFGLISMALYFGNSMSSELRASDNRVSGIAAEQAIEG